MTSSRSKSALSKGEGKETMTQRDDAELFRILRKEVVQKCFIDQEVLRDNDTFVVKATEQQNAQRFSTLFLNLSSRMS